MLITTADLPGIRAKHEGEKIVLGGGAFDILHQGHIDYLRDLKALGDILVIAIKSDAEIRSYKDSDRPIQAEDVRLKVIDAIRYVDYTFIAPEPVGPLKEFGDSEPPRLIAARALKPDILATWNDKWRAYEAELSSFGTKLVVVPIDKINSTSSIIERIRNHGEG